MIVLTVKTLDSQNHTFTVDDDITVEQFKAKIAETVNIPAETQRIIYCGRVLQDNVKLNDYDVNGKVVHLVQRPPPGQNPPTTRSASPQPSRRGFRAFGTVDGGNTMYLGSMAFPSNLMESQGIVPPPPTHSLAGSRLNVARRMLRRASAVIGLLENPTARPSDQPPEEQDEEVTPIIEARVIVPRGNNENIDEDMVLSAVQNTLFEATQGTIPMSTDVSVDSNNPPQGTSETFSPEQSTSSTPEEESTNATENSQERRNARTLAENASRTSEMAELLTTLNQLQVRFAPFLERYRQFMVDDPVITQNARQTQTMLNRVSEVLHYLGHAYHSLSDIILRVRTLPPRPLLCRPILIQHSAVVQAGIPIQVEAQFNLSTDRPTRTATSTSTTSAESSSSATTTTTTTTTSSDTTGSSTAGPQTQPTVNFRSFPFIPGASMRVQSFPIELRAAPRPTTVSTDQRGQNNNNNTVGGTDNTSGGTATGSGGSENTFNAPTFNNSSVEFFMEVTPEVLQGNLNGPPPELLQSLVQMAGQIMNRVTTTTAPSTGSTSTTSESTQSNTSSQMGSAGQNSQARGNTQTNPTTSTHTRSTSRPHVHLAQQAMQGGFDPFLPCNSHHVTNRRRMQQVNVSRQQNQQGQQQQGQEQENSERQEHATSPQQQTPDAQSRQRQQQAQREALLNRILSSERTQAQIEAETAALRSFHEVFANIYNNLRVNVQGRSATEEGATTANTQSQSSANAGSGSDSQQPPPFAFLHTPADNMDRFRPSTLAELFGQLSPDTIQSRPGENLVTDLVMLLARRLSILDLIMLITGDPQPLSQTANELRTFVQRHILRNELATPESINAGVERLVTDLQPFFQRFNQLPVRDNIDMVRSVELLFRRRLPEIVTTASNVTTDNFRELVNQCIALAKIMCALALHASVNGPDGVNETLSQIINSYTEGLSSELTPWTNHPRLRDLRNFLSGLGISNDDIEQYIIRNSDVAMTSPSQSETRSVQSQETTEPMELDEPMVPSNNTTVQPLSIGGDENEPLPNVLIGSEPWHNQVPEDWVPIITRDVQRQRRQNPQAPFSDAYLSGMPTKRRKIVNSSKPQGSLPQVIAESVRRAITVTGLASVAPLEVVSQAAGDSTDVQAAYRSLLRTTVQTALRDNEDFTPERFPHATTYFKTQ